MEFVANVLSGIWADIRAVLSNPFDPNSRIFWLYLISSTVAAYFVYRSVRRRGMDGKRTDAEAAKGSFVEYLFPKSVWSHPSAWLDLRYALFHRILMQSLLGALGGVSLVLGYKLISGQWVIETFASGNPTTFTGWLGAGIFMFITMLIMDLGAWFLHFLQHKVPVLWQFHKVHHSAEVMHPISNFREHPIDNITYTFFLGLLYGIIYALAVRWLGFLPSMPSLLGVPLLMFLFNLVAYNLRHSHVWLRWPGVWSVVFPSPAHHHVHHSCHPDHIDKNFAFMFPVWDVIFGTYEMPEDNQKVKFGVTTGDDADLDSVFRLYWVPFRDAYRVVKRARKKRSKMNAPEADTVGMSPDP
jgi:sterol desaturase/sphingolipid hydroxylase (fatty acid hydroxylase superfamily)